MDPEVAYLYEPGDIDSASVEMLPDSPALYAFQVVLSGEADPLWRRAFDQVWRESRYLGKLDALVVGDRIRFICSQRQGMTDYLYLIESRIRETNRRMEAHWRAKRIPTKTLRYQHYPSSFIPLVKI
ncbi:MAG: hypothetical protein HUU16_02930 [Candidatus Omnitrophica bacterium]|nr:hypothetical protein [bacterium]NUN95105.1 hypothetical protein [Candidatus Omnitrophota bacterium]